MMGLTYANFNLTNLFSKKSVDIKALVDTGAMFLCIPHETAIQLGFDPTEVSTKIVTLADGRQIHAPCITPVKIVFDEQRYYTTEALVLGDEPLMGVLPLEAMDLVVDPRNQKLSANPLHPNYPVAHAK